MFVDPIPVAAAAPTPALSFAMIRTDGYGSERLDATNRYGLKFQHSENGSGERHYMQITQDLDATDPTTGLVSQQTMSVSLSVSVPKTGFSAAAQAALVTALFNTLNDADVTVAKFLTWNS